MRELGIASAGLAGAGWLMLLAHDGMIPRQLEGVLGVAAVVAAVVVGMLVEERED